MSKEALAKQEEQPSCDKQGEPVAEIILWREEKIVQWEQSLPVGTKFYTTPQQRKPLTDEQIEACLHHVDEDGIGLFAFARAIEAAHGIKE